MSFYTDFGYLRIGRNDVVYESTLNELIAQVPNKYNIDVLMMVFFAARTATNAGTNGVPLYLYVDTYVERVKNTINEVSQARLRWMQAKEDIATLDNELSNIALNDPRYAEMVARPNIDQQAVIAHLVETGGVGEVAAHLLFAKLDITHLENKFGPIFAPQRISENPAAAPVHLGGVVVHAECQGQEVYTAVADLKRDVAATASGVRATAKLNELLTFESSPHDANSEVILTVTLRTPHSRDPIFLGRLVVDFRTEGSAQPKGVQLLPRSEDGVVSLQMQLTWSPVKARVVLDRREKQIKRLAELVVDLNKAKNHLESLTKPFPELQAAGNAAIGGAGGEQVAISLRNAIQKVFGSVVPQQIAMRVTVCLLLCGALSCFARADFLNLLLAVCLLHLNVSNEDSLNDPHAASDVPTNKGLFGIVGANRYGPEIYMKIIYGLAVCSIVDVFWLATYLNGWAWSDPEWGLHIVAKLATIVGLAAKVLALGFFWVCHREYTQRQLALTMAEKVMNANVNRV